MILKTISNSFIKQNYFLTQNSTAIILKISKSTLKRKLRDFDIEEFPSKKLRDLNEKIKKEIKKKKINKINIINILEEKKNIFNSVQFDSNYINYLIFEIKNNQNFNFINVDLILIII